MGSQKSAQELENERQKKKRKIQSQINQKKSQRTSLEKSKASLEKSKSSYENMKRKINNEVLPQLDNAKKLVVNSKNGLKNAYTGKQATKGYNQICDVDDEINTICKNFRNVILVEIDRKIKDLNSRITNLNRQITSLNRQIANLQYQYRIT